MSLPYAKISRIAAVLLFTVAISCGDSQETTKPGTKYATGEEQLIAEFGQDVDPAAVDRVLEISKELTLTARSEGIQEVINALKTKLATKHLDGSVLDEIEDYTIGQPLPGVNPYFDEPLEPNGISSTAQAIETPSINEQYFACPPQVENENVGTAESCYELVKQIGDQVKAGLDSEELRQMAEDMIAQDELLSSQSDVFKDFALDYLMDLATDIHQFGADVAAVRAEYLLRSEEMCDDVFLHSGEVARLRGIKESETIIREMIEERTYTIAPQGNDCLVIGATGVKMEQLIEKKVEAYLEENPLECVDLNSDNPVVQEAEEARKEGIEHGIDAHTATIWIGIFRNSAEGEEYHPFKAESYTVAVIDGCEPKDQIKYTTSPLVVDLDGDGLDLTTEGVPFDLMANGQPQKVSWAGKREGILALDLDGNGRITSGRELFGNRTLCLGEKCADGAAALAVYDAKAKGGNQDGRIDAGDKIFSSLKVWVDANQNGRSEPEELSSLADQGIKAISLKVTPMDQQVPGGRLSLSLGVETDHGTRTAYDVWFDNVVTSLFKASPSL